MRQNVALINVDGKNWKWSDASFLREEESDTLWEVAIVVEKYAQLHKDIFHYGVDNCRICLSQSFKWGSPQDYIKYIKDNKELLEKYLRIIYRVGLSHNGICQKTKEHIEQHKRKH